MLVWDPQQELGGNTREQLARARVLLWKGHCSVHQRFRPEHVDRRRQQLPSVKILVHPECAFEVVEKADLVGSTEFIICQISNAAPGSKWAVGTEIHLVNRLSHQFPEQTIVPLEDSGCPVCSTMFRISPQHLCWALENLEAGRVVNRITVPDTVCHWARVALDRMLTVH
jgi:quinolinate synthase